MKRLFWLLVLFPVTAFALTFNSQGTSGAPKSVSNSAVKVLAGNTQRKSWTILAETVDIRCMAGGTNDSAPTITPTTSVGFLIKTGTYVTCGPGPNSNVPAAVDPQQRLDCISVGAATGASTSETP